MLVVIAEHLPDAVRGKLKLWFIEPRANVFISIVADALARKIVLQLMDVCSPESGVLIVESQAKSPGYLLWERTNKPTIGTISGFQLVQKKVSSFDNTVSKEPE